jgi:hypothetical protein
MATLPTGIPARTTVAGDMSEMWGARPGGRVGLVQL